MRDYKAINISEDIKCQNLQPQCYSYPRLLTNSDKQELSVKYFEYRVRNLQAKEKCVG